MNLVGKTPEHLNPIDRDLTIVFSLGFVIAVTIVTMGIMVVNYI